MTNQTPKISVHLSQEQMKVLKDIASREGLPASTYARYKLLKVLKKEKKEGELQI